MTSKERMLIAATGAEAHGFATSSWLRQSGYGEGAAGATWVRVVVKKDRSGARPPAI